MPAELETMFYHGETPWHRLGTHVDHALTSTEAIVQAGLDWEVDLVSLFHNYKGSKLMVPDRKGVRRNTDGSILGIVSPEYKPVQNKDAFKFFDSVVGTGQAIYNTAGSLRGGKRVWMLAKLDKDGPMSIKGDAVDKYLLLMNSHDGYGALKMFFTPVRVVCMNTLAAAEAGSLSAETFYSKHFGNVEGRMQQAQEILGLSVQYFDNFKEQANHLAKLMLPAPEMPKLLCAAFGTTGSIRPENVVQISDFATSTRQQNEMERVVALFEGEGKGLDNPAIKGTKWAAYNAVTEYCDYRARQHGDNAADNRLESVWLWGGKQVKQKAWNYLLQ